MKKTLTLSLSLLLVACGKTKYIATSGHEDAPATKAKNVTVYMAPNEIPANAERIGLITSHKGKEHKAFNKAKSMAAAHGGNAILFTDGKELNGGQKLANTFLWPGTFKAKWKFFVFHIPETE